MARIGKLTQMCLSMLRKKAKSTMYKGSYFDPLTEDLRCLEF